MINTRTPLTTFDAPFLHHTADGLVSPADLARLNAEPPPRGAFTRYVKEGPGYVKEYRMWLLTVYRGGSALPAADDLPAAWSRLLSCVLDDEFRGWLSEGTGINLIGHPLDVGIYLRGPGDFQGRATGKTAKAMNLTLYLNDEWNPGWGGEYELWNSKETKVATRRIIPRGGNCDTIVQTDSSWHSISPVLEAGRGRITMTLEYWKP